ncbi:transporter [Xylophilus sp. GW821-FHT01B05]
MKTPYRFLLAALAAFPATGALACATCGCTLSADAAMGYSSEPGWQFNLDYSYINQNQLRSGTGRATAQQLVNAPSNPSLGGGEVENQTRNRYLTLGLTYRPDPDWSVSFLVPYVDRGHSTYGQQSQPYTPVTPDQLSSGTASGLGDVKVMGAYQGFLATRNLGVQFGVKLPTGSYGGMAADGSIVGHPAYFGSGGNSAGQPLDTSLQTGNGSTDLIVGGYYYQPVSQDFDAFVNGQFQAAVAHRLNQAGADFRPGNQTTVSFGLRYEADPALVPQLQVNISRKMADQGYLADTTDTAGTAAYLSPGATVALGQNLHGYAFLQLPVYRKLDGYQLAPKWTVSVGLSYSL